MVFVPRIVALLERFIAEGSRPGLVPDRLEELLGLGSFQAIQLTSPEMSECESAVCTVGTIPARASCDPISLAWNEHHPEAVMKLWVLQEDTLDASDLAVLRLVARSFGEALTQSENGEAVEPMEVSVGGAALEDRFDTGSGLLKLGPFKKRLAGWLDGADAGSSLTAVLCALRIQGLERIRALAGSEAVDDAVRTVASNLFEAFGNGATGCRSGEDTILLLLTGLPKPELAAENMLQVHEKLEQGVQVKNAEGPPVGIVLRVGMAPWTPNYREEETWLDDSQRALAQVGSGSSQRQAFFSQTMHVLNVDRWRMEADLQDAIRSESLEAYLQPIVEMESGRPMGFEALARWTHPERGFVSPAEFIPVAEASGLVVDLGAHMLRHAVAQLVDLRAAFPEHKDLFVSVNLSAHQLGRDDLLGTVLEVLSNSGLPPQALKLEVTETVLVTGTELARNILEELRAHGVRIALDDFGTGYSSMAYLREFPLDTLKIDRSFVEGAGVDANGEGIIRSIIQLGQDLGLEVIGEGVETEEQAELLQRLTCPLGQGYLWSRPLPPAEVYPWMAARSRV